MTGLPSYFHFEKNKIFHGSKEINIITLGDILKKSNYDFQEYYVGEANFVGTKNLLETMHFKVSDNTNSTGNYEVYPDTFGYHDKDLFFELKKRIKDLKSNNKSFAIFGATINTHLNGIKDNRMSKLIGNNYESDTEHSVKSLDYLIGDSFVTPQNESSHFTEKIFRLPNIWVSFTPPNISIEIDQLPAIKNGYITFGCFNNLSKINDKVIFLWSRILKSIPKSKIFLKTKELSNSYLKEKIVNKFRKNDIDINSIILEEGSPRNELINSYNKVDVALDPFPYSGGVTSFEALWMGVPVLTKKGFKFVSHTTESINHNSAMSDWIATSDDEYLSKAIQFTSNLAKLKKIRNELRKKVLNSPSFNSSLFADQFSNALWKMWNKFILKN